MKLKLINELTIAAYNSTADKYHQNFKDEIERKEFDRKILDRYSDMLAPSSLICDAGCGPSGHIGKYLSGKGHKIFGIDISPKCIEIAGSFNPGTDYKVMDMMNTDFPDNTFDGIISFYSIIYTPKEHAANFFKEYYRILKKNGKILLAVKKGSSEGIIEDEWYEGNKVYFTHFLEDEITKFFHDNNFNMDYIETREPYEFEIKVERIYSIGSKQ